MELTREQLYKRKAEFPQFIIDLSYNNTIIYHIIELYVHGVIVSKEEAYCQMVKELSVSYDEMIKRLTNEAHLKTILYIKPNG